MRTKFLFIAWCLFTTVVSYSQYIDFQSLELDWVAEKDRAHFGEVTALHEDPLGIIWLGVSAKGLAIYNGSSIQRVPLEGESSFADDFNVFTGFENELYLKFDRTIQVFNTFSQSVEDTITVDESVDGSIGQLSVIRAGEDVIVWATIIEQSQGDYVNFRLAKSVNHSPFRVVNNKTYQSLGEPFVKLFSDKKLLIKSTDGLAVLNQDGIIQRTHYIDEVNTRALTANNTVIDKQDAIWFPSVYRQHRSSSDYCFNCHKVNKITPEGKTKSFQVNTHKNYIYGIQSHMGGLSLEFISLLGDYVIAGLTAINVLDDDDIQTTDELFTPIVIEGQSGIYFVGGNNGFMIYRRPSTSFQKIPSFATRSLIEMPSGIILGTINSGYTVDSTRIYSPSRDRVYQSQHIDITSNDSYHLCYQDSIIISGKHKINVITGERESIRQVAEDYAGGAHLSLIDKDNRLWKAQWDHPLVGLYDLVTGDRIKSIVIPEIQKNPVQLNDWYQRKSNGEVWLGSNGYGIYIFSPDGDLIRKLDRSLASTPRLNNDFVSAFYEDDNGDMWIGHGSGLSHIRNTNRSIKHFYIDENNPESRMVYAILAEDNGQILWLSTSRGLYRFDTNTGVFMDFPLDKDIMNLEFNRTSYLKASDGRFYFGTSSNKTPTVAFWPDEVAEAYNSIDSANVSLYLNSLLLKKTESEEVVNLGLNALERLVLEKDVKAFELNYLLTDFRAQRSLFYSSWLEGYDNEWKKPKRLANTIRYENLKPGKYVLHLAAGLVPNVERMTQKSIMLVVAPYWYQTNWAKILFFLIGASSIWMIYRYNLTRQYQLQEARRIKELSTVKSKLYTNITHEFRTPLTVIMGLTENIERHPKGKELIMRNANNLLMLVNEMMDLAKLEDGKLKLKLQEGDLAQFVSYLVESFTSLAARKQIQLQFEASSDTIPCLFDENMIQHILNNLLSNAIKFTKEEGKISVSLKHENAFNVLEVQDSGIGISKKELAHIFDRFYQADDPINEEVQSSQGSGIGLSLVREIVQFVGGDIQVESVINEGTRFIVRLPHLTPTAQNRLAEKGQKTEKSSKTSEQQVLEDSEKPVILLAEDNEDVAFYVKSILSTNFIVQHAWDGVEALEMAIEQVPDIIITDVMMPRKNGLAFCADVKHDRRTSHIPVIMLTAKADFESKMEGFETGADAYLAKPFQKSELLIRIKNLLSLRSKIQLALSSASSLHPAQDSIAASPKPDVIAPTPVADAEIAFVNELRQVVLTRIQEVDFSVYDLSGAVNMNHVQVNRKLKALTGETSVQFIRKTRLQQAHKLLLTTELNISEIAFEVGFNDPNYFTRAYKKEYGVVPSDAKR